MRPHSEGQPKPLIKDPNHNVQAFPPPFTDSHEKTKTPRTRGKVGIKQHIKGQNCKIGRDPAMSPAGELNATPGYQLKVRWGGCILPLLSLFKSLYASPHLDPLLSSSFPAFSPSFLAAFVFSTLENIRYKETLVSFHLGLREVFG